MEDNVMVNDAVQEAVKKGYYFVHNRANVKSQRQENQKNQNKKKKSREYYRNLSEDETIKKMNYVNNRNKNMMQANREKNI